MKNQIKNIEKRDYDPFQATDSEKKEFLEVAQYWEGKTLYDMWVNSCPEDITTKTFGTLWAEVSNAVFPLGYHFAPDWDEVLNKGLKSYKKSAQDKLRNLDLSMPENLEKEHFYRAVIIVIEAIDMY
ncbi:MAG: hypothetical protein GTN76_15680, partial [Candidatus Aenigmarchaeota archaeon]|nr:hypothetical protein [Candidatus Aenigmarchaeota archaeon]